MRSFNFQIRRKKSIYLRPKMHNCTVRNISGNWHLRYQRFQWYGTFPRKENSSAQQAVPSFVSTTFEIVITWWQNEQDFVITWCLFIEIHKGPLTNKYYCESCASPLFWCRHLLALILTAIDKVHKSLKIITTIAFCMCRLRSVHRHINQTFIRTSSEHNFQLDVPKVHASHRAAVFTGPGRND